MTDKMRHVTEYERARYFAVDSATVIERGDMLWLDTDDVKPASDFTWDTDLETTQLGFAKVYAGIAAQKSDSGDTDVLRSDMDGVFAMANASATWEVGDKVAPAKAAGNALVDQTVVATNRLTGAIGRVAYRETAAVTEVRVKLESRLQTLNCCFATTTTTTTTTSTV